MTTPTPLVETLHAGEHIVFELRELSRDAITLTGAAKLFAGTVLGTITEGAETNAAGTNTGNGAMGTVTTGAAALPGVYTLKFTKANAGAGDFEVIDPNGEVGGVGTAGLVFNGGGLSFTLAVGGTNWVVGDSFTLTVAAGSGKAKQLNPSGTDGSQNASGILFGGADATLADVPAVANNRLTAVNPAQITWPVGITTQQKATAIAQLLKLNIIMRA